MVEHQWKDSTTGHLIKTSMENLRLELGLNINILMSDYTQYEELLITSSWVRSTWQFMSDHHIQYDDKHLKHLWEEIMIFQLWKALNRQVLMDPY